MPKWPKDSFQWQTNVKPHGLGFTIKVDVPNSVICFNQKYGVCWLGMLPRADIKKKICVWKMLDYVLKYDDRLGMAE